MTTPAEKAAEYRNTADDFVSHDQAMYWVLQSISIELSRIASALERSNALDHPQFGGPR